MVTCISSLIFVIDIKVRSVSVQYLDHSRRRHFFLCDTRRQRISSTMDIDKRCYRWFGSLPLKYSCRIWIKCDYRWLPAYLCLTELQMWRNYNSVVISTVCTMSTFILVISQCDGGVYRSTNWYGRGGSE